MREGIEFRYTLSNPNEGSIEIDEPIGWDASKFTLPRDKKHHSLSFEYSSQLKFYFNNGQHNGGGEFILLILNKYGPDGEVSILVEAAEGNEPFEEVFTGRVTMETIVETEQHVECMFQQDAFFTTFNQRSDLKVSFKDNKSVDGGALQEYNPYELTLHSKVLVKRTEVEIIQEFLSSGTRTHEVNIPFGPPGFPDTSKTGTPLTGGQPDTKPISRTSYIQFNLSNTTVNELEDYWEVQAGSTSSVPPEIYTAKEAGLHSFDINLSTDILVHGYRTSGSSTYVTCSDNEQGYLEDVKIKFVLKILDVEDNEKYIQETTTTEVNVCGQDYATVPAIANFTPLVDFELEVDDKVFLYAEVIMEGVYAQMIVDANFGLDVGHILKEGSYLNITGKTFTEDSTGNAFRVHDLLQNLINKLTNRNDSFYSECFGYQEAPYHSYTEKGCYADYAILDGFGVRGFPWALRPLQPVFNEIFDSLSSMLNLGLGLEKIDDVWKIRVEPLSYFYDKESILTLTAIRGMKRTISKELFYNQIQIGYEKWQPEEINGLDEFNTKLIFSTALKTIGEPLVLLSKIIASGSLIEVTRRLQYDATVSTDSKYDNDFFIVALNKDDPTIAEKNENFQTVNNLLSPETAYNLRLWPTFNLLRHGNRINGCLLKKLGSEYVFSSGEGNYIIELQFNEDQIDCPGTYNAELLQGGENIPWAYADLPEVEPLWEPIEVGFKFPIGYTDLQLIKAFKNKCLTINGDILEDGEYIKVFILEVETEPVRGLGTFKCLKCNTLPFNYVPEDADNLLLQDGFNLLTEEGNLILL